MKLAVTQDDLRRGKRGAAWESPLGYACVRAFEATYAFVGATICLDTGLRIDLHDWKLGLELMTAFDNGAHIEPCELPLSAETLYRASLK